MQSTEEIDVQVLERTRETHVEHKQTASFHNAPATSQLTLKKSKKTKRQAGTCTGQVSIAVAEDTIGVGGGAAMIAMQQECERHFLPVNVPRLSWPSA